LISADVSTDDLKGPLSNRHVSHLDEQGLNRLHDRVLELFHLNPVVTRWERQRRQFLAQLSAMQGNLAESYLQSVPVMMQRASRYANAAKQIHEAFHHFRDAASLRILYPEHEVGSHRSRFLQDVTLGINCLAQAFSTFLRKDCRVCIKQVEAPEIGGGGTLAENEVYVADLARSGSDRVRRRRNELDLVHENTDFEEILHGDNAYFFCNDLVALYDAGRYKNSHWKKGVPDKPAYVSTIVWPIRKVLDTAIPARLPASRSEISEWQDLLGFLCIDSKVKGVFDQGADVQLGAAVADTLYHVLAPWLSHFRLLPPTPPSS
jgi:hypothetical protein